MEDFGVGSVVDNQMGLRTGLTRGAPGANCIHLCVDMQRMFAEPTPWQMPWMPRVAPIVRRVAARRPDRTVFTRFIPADRPGEGQGLWRDYYMRWACMTRERLDPAMMELLPDLAEFVPPATLFDKRHYSPWIGGHLRAELESRATDTLLLTGGETDVCVIATVLGAVDHGYRVIVVADALCSSSDEAHDAALSIYTQRFGQQIEVVEAEEVLAIW